MSTRSARTLKILIALLVIASPLIYWQRWAIPGVTFAYTMASAGCLLLAALLLLFLPWQNSFVRKLCRVLRWVYLAGACALALSFAVLQGAIWSTAAAARAQQPGGDCLLVLGAGLLGETPSAILQNRLLVAYDYLSANPQAVAVLSGGQGPGETVTEASAMRAWLVNRGIDESRLYMEDRATSTGENIAFSQPIIAGLGYEEAIIVTNDFHLLRAALLSAHYGLKTELMGAPTPAYILIPFVSYAREYFALVKDGLLLYLYPQGLPKIPSEV